ncbi:GNAT family N-acetyltransferase [Burkholderia sp. MS455]|uniref:GNAT family N-acetyltransferase n=1 Tax=Burkholderia sp. MS455 TaxID=2811788 RepID=UPI0019575030|nr:GNAT family N-acetyltransferase [Burkholderia sp. MS455]QRR07550.1 GNAT family N-acetyltransferase [Burkholderia sp. MS455]
MKTTTSTQDLPVADLQTARLILRPATTTDVAPLLAYHLNNRQHLQPWEPLRGAEFYTRPALQSRLENMALHVRSGNALHWLIWHPDSDTLLGECNFTNIIRGIFQACHLGYSIAESAQGQGFMYEALSRSIEYVFDTYGLHRIMASYRPENIRSEKLLKRLGFETEGVARSYLKINGQWADHVLTSRINPQTT